MQQNNATEVITFKAVGIKAMTLEEEIYRKRNKMLIPKQLVTTKDTPMSLMCGTCNLRCFTEIKALPYCGCLALPPAHYCSNCGAILVRIGRKKKK